MNKYEHDSTCLLRAQLRMQHTGTARKTAHLERRHPRYQLPGQDTKGPDVSCQGKNRGVQHFRRGVRDRTHAAACHLHKQFTCKRFTISRVTWIRLIWSLWGNDPKGDRRVQHLGGRVRDRAHTVARHLHGCLLRTSFAIFRVTWIRCGILWDVILWGPQSNRGIQNFQQGACKRSCPHCCTSPAWALYIWKSLAFSG